MIDNIASALPLVFNYTTLSIIFASALFGLFVGAIPGLSATMATAILVPITFFMDPVPAIAAIVTTAAMAIFASDIPTALLRIPGTAASAAYVNDMNGLAVKGKVGHALGISVFCAAFGGIFGSLVLMFTAPKLALVSLNFTSTEYFWLALLGLTAAVMLGSGSILKSLLSLGIGLFIATIGLDSTAGHPRFVFGIDAILSGVAFIPALIGMFAIPEIIRTIVYKDSSEEAPVHVSVRSLFSGLGKTLYKYKLNMLRGSAIGNAVGILPGAGSDIGSWISYAVSKKMSRYPEKYGSGHDEGLVDACSANNSSLSGAYVPAMVFGIPGDSITAIVIGVLYAKGLNPGPLVFITKGVEVTAIFITFLVANLLIIPLGLVAILISRHLLQVKKSILIPFILIFAIAGSYAIDNTYTGIVIMLLLGLLAYFMEENGLPVAPAILGIVMGPMLESNLITSLIKSDGNFLEFFSRPIAATLGIITLCIWFMPLLLGLLRKYQNTQRSGYL
ncbi:tripartite tricarboxylate transporter permease [Vreelandella titanicae]|uniref:tripartite tricarboxylate transporter permease n=1 Tax=Vreelandella titanicae TaxID=664683 RepID=UPI0013736DFB|nr:C4-dicarboxylate ABC transporter permease [Halomonas sp. MG34]|tara:strand:+ start:4459 stop:5970 length:1512 start_codon:yes stop_codon:yes gene_type:complete